MIRLLIVILFLLYSCSPNSIEECREEAKNISKELIHYLKKVKTKEDLKYFEDKIEKNFYRLAKIMILIKKIQSKSLEKDCYNYDTYINDELFCQLSRIYKIDSGREIIAKLQKKAICKLLEFEKKSKQQKE